MKREKTLMSIGNKHRPNSAASGSQLGEFLHCRNTLNFAYPPLSVEPAAVHSLRIKLTEQLPDGYQFFDYRYNPTSDTLMWESTNTRKEYNSAYFFSLVRMIEQFKKPWIMKTFPGSFVNNKFYNTSILDVENMLVRLNKISTPIILVRDFKSWIVSLYFGNKHGKYSPAQLTTEFLESINKPQVIPQAFIDFQSNQYRIFYGLIEKLFPNSPRYEVKKIYEDPSSFLTGIGLPPPAINVSAIEYSKLDYKKIIINYDDIVCTPHGGLSPHHI
jgi:hypothetical protein